MNSLTEISLSNANHLDIARINCSVYTRKMVYIISGSPKEGDSKQKRKGQCDHGDSDWTGCESRNAGSHLKLEEAKNGFSSRASGGSVVLLTTWYQPSDADLGHLASRV